MPTASFEAGYVSSTNVTLSGSNLVATCGTTGTRHAGCQRPMTGLTYFEMVAGALAGTTGVGIGTNSFGWGGASAMGGDFLSLIYRSGGTVVINSATVATLATYANGDRISVAVDVANRLIWFKVNAGNWNNNVANDPATGVGGISMSTLTGVGYHPAVSFNNSNGTNYTAYFATGSFTYTPPTGYQSIEDVQVSAAVNAAAFPGPAVATVIAYEAYNNQLKQTKQMFSPAGALTYIRGEVQENGTPVAGKIVRLYDKFTGDEIAETVSAGDGTFELPAVGSVDVYAVALDPPFQAIIYDQLVPVT